MTSAHRSPRSFLRSARLPVTGFAGLSLLSLVMLGVVAPACTTETAGTPTPSASTTTGTPVTWTNAPASAIVIKQGIPSSVPFKLSGAAEVSFAAAPGVTVTRDGEALTIVTDYEAAGAQKIDVTIKASNGAVASASLALDVKALTWSVKKSWKDGEGPEGREHPAMFLDQKNHVSYMLQGSGYKPQFRPLSDAWKFDMVTQTWSAWAPTGDVPGPGLARRAVGPAKDGSFLLVGGEIEGEKLDGELYRLDFAGGGEGSFKKLTQTNAPPARSLHFFGMDAELGKSVLFGGFSYETGQTLNDTWILTTSGDAATWRKVNIPKAAAPTGRYGGFSALDESSHKFFVYSGGQQPKSGSPVNPAEDTWVFDLQAETWSLLETTGAAPAGRRNGCTMHDTTHRRMFVFGGTPNGSTSSQGLHVLDLARGTWSPVAGETPPSRSSGAGFFDAQTGRMYCGFGNSAAVYMDTNGFGYAD